ncbi:uncharacterized protein LOC110020146 [Phalaenopsis equestris]|uniref:uncharacterized protein LOC110020146 n=1 Tax=Phalaenopsis equestris TaxID=78828 RepID=UPI0009E26DC2|nr:uncharacterized protein LOC110020146 [Phalaenopsis equestris]XP_020573798.1 uncharacterized protein LOC110020146 [Phalaenopsis equestris]XP_020573799.1 uncharacterized protein LOC110020146 [Phalaenopsis equestris]
MTSGSLVRRTKNVICRGGKQRKKKPSTGTQSPPLGELIERDSNEPHAQRPEDGVSLSIQFAGMTGGSSIRRTKNVICRGELSNEIRNRAPETQSPPLGESVEKHYNELHKPRLEDGVSLSDEQRAFMRRRGRTTFADFQNLPPETQVQIDINDNIIPCNILKYDVLGSCIGVIARDLVLAHLLFSNWRKEGMEPFKKKMLAEMR